MSTATANKLKIKDIITVVLLALINVVIFFASSVLYATPITIILMPVFFALLEGIVYFIIGTKSFGNGSSHICHFRTSGSFQIGSHTLIIREKRSRSSHFRTHVANRSLSGS